MAFNLRNRSFLKELDTREATASRAMPRIPKRRGATRIATPVAVRTNPLFRSLLGCTRIPPVMLHGQAMTHAPAPKRPGDPNGNARRDEREQGFIA